MRRSRRLSGLEPDAVPDIINNPLPKRTASKKKKSTGSSSKKENQPPSRSARKTQQKAPRTKRAASSRVVGSKKRTTPKKNTTPKRGRPTKPRTTAKRSRSAKKDKKSTKSAKQPKSLPIHDADSDDETPNKGTTDIHPKTHQTPVADRKDDQKTDEPDEKRDELPPAEPSPVTPSTILPADTQTKKSGVDGHSLNFLISGMLVSIIFLYFVSFCRAMSCSAFTYIPFIGRLLVPEMLDFNMGATAVTTGVLYITALAYCRKWLQSDGFMSADEGAYMTLHAVHGILLILHTICCKTWTPPNNENAAQCTLSLVALSIGFYTAALAMQPTFSWHFVRNFVACSYVISFHYYLKKDAYPFVLLMAVKSVICMIVVHFTDVKCSERSQVLDFAAAIACAFLAYLVPVQ